VLLEHGYGYAAACCPCSASLCCNSGVAGLSKSMKGIPKRANLFVGVCL